MKKRNIFLMLIISAIAISTISTTVSAENVLPIPDGCKTIPRMPDDMNKEMTPDYTGMKIIDVNQVIEEPTYDFSTDIIVGFDMGYGYSYEGELTNVVYFICYANGFVELVVQGYNGYQFYIGQWYLNNNGEITMQDSWIPIEQPPNGQWC